MDPNAEIRTIMSKDVVFATPNETIEKVLDKLLNNLIHHIPVVENGNLLGIISQNDIHKLEHHFTLFENPEAVESNRQLFSTLLAREIMTTPVVKVREDEPLSIAADIFLENMFHALPVVDAEDKIVGMLSTFDMIRYTFRNK